MDRFGVGISFKGSSMAKKSLIGEPQRERGRGKKFYYCSQSPQIPRLPLTYVNRKLWSRAAEGAE